MYEARGFDRYRSIIIGILVIMIWALSLVFFLTLDLGSVPFWLIIPAFFWQTFLYTGLFITAHDSMHGSLVPGNRKLNNLMGRTAVFLYAMFSYDLLREKHWEHHRAPATSEDPDYHDGVHSSFFAWYFKFMAHYLRPLQMLGMAVVFGILVFIFGLPLVNVLIFWVGASLASTLQLFYFGTYRPHREPSEGYQNRFRANPNDYPVPVSLITCYHFGYHVEHHAYPNVQWWRLPYVKKNEEFS